MLLVDTLNFRLQPLDLLCGDLIEDDMCTAWHRTASHAAGTW